MNIIIISSLYSRSLGMSRWGAPPSRGSRCCPGRHNNCIWKRCFDDERLNLKPDIDLDLLFPPTANFKFKDNPCTNLKLQKQKHILIWKLNLLHYKILSYIVIFFWHLTFPEDCPRCSSGPRPSQPCRAPRPHWPCWCRARCCPWSWRRGRRTPPAARPARRRTAHWQSSRGSEFYVNWKSSLSDYKEGLKCFSNFNRRSLS